MVSAERARAYLCAEATAADTATARQNRTEAPAARVRVCDPGGYRVDGLLEEAQSRPRQHGPADIIAWLRRQATVRRLRRLSHLRAIRIRSR